MNFNFCRSCPLQTKITVFTLAIFVLSIWTLAFYSGRMLRKDMQELLGKQQFSTASFIAADVDYELTERLHALEKVAKTLSPVMLEGSAALQTFLEQRPVLQDQFSAGIILLDGTGTVIAEVPRSAGRIGVNYSNRDHIIGALKEGKTMIGRPLMGHILHAPLLAMATPIRDPQGKIVGAISGVTDLSKPNFLDRISENGFGQTGAYYLNAPQQALVVTSSVKNRIMGALPAPGVNPMLDRYRNGYEGTDIFIDPNGMEVLASVKRVPIAGWYVAVRLATAEAFGPIHALQQRLLLATLLFTLLAGVLIWWLLHRQLAPLLTTAKTLAQLTDGNQPLQALPVARQDEIGQLVSGFNRLLASLNQRETLLKQILDTASVAIFLVDRDGRITRANQRMAEMFCCSQETLVGSEYVALVQPAQREVARQKMLDLMASAIPSVDLDRLYLRTDKTEFWGNLTGKRLHDSKGEELGLVGVIADINVRKKQEIKLNLTAQVLAQSREGVVITDADATILMVNPALCGITGYSEAELLGQNPRILKSGNQNTAFYAALWQTLLREGQWAGEVWNKHKNGALYPQWLSISALRDAQGNTSHFVGNVNDLRTAKEAENRIEWLQHFDGLTGLPNRTLLQDRTSHAINMVKRSQAPLAMMLIGIDHFKTVNETLGHQRGDELLVEVAKRLTGAVRTQDTVAHVGGKEFVLVLPGTEASGAAHLARELLWKLAQPYQLGSHELNLTASIGIASYPDNGENFETLLTSVQIAERRARINGRNTFEFYNSELHAQMLARDAMTKALRQAIALEQLQLVYQPQVDLQTGHISGLEALLRWQHPELGAVPPARFIPIAEKAGLIIDIGEWVLQRACRDLLIWLDSGLKVPHVSVNASPLQFRNNDFVAQVRSALTKSEIDPALLYIEVTESTLMEDVPRKEAMFNALKGLGVKLSLDDFGTGYSSLSYLKRLPFDQVKIDQSFVRDVATNASDSMLINVIVSMAHGFGMKVIAEGVETQTQCEIMRNASCDEIQGYFFSRPVSAEAITELFSEGRQLPAHLLRQQTT